jgi:citrate lyase subunit beta/citryl-CoA lyase
MRSLLFVPAHDERKLAKSLGSGADALVLDLEDGVPMPDKARAREICAEFVSQHRGTRRLFVRVNALESGLLLDDLAAIVRAHPYGIMLPKSRSGHDVALLDSYMAALEARDGIDVGSLRLLPIVTESAAGLLGMDSYAGAAGSRLCGMMWGGEDLAADIGATANRGIDGRYTAPYTLARTLTLLGATAAGVPAIDAVFTNFRDGEGLAEEAREAVRDGFSAKAAFHPDQIAPINDAFTPSDADVAWANKVLAAFDEAPGKFAVTVDGRVLDRPYYQTAQRMLARAGVSSHA